jgi:D-serine deaminase-like pyridoxal phosphate-dependent protein
MNEKRRAGGWLVKPTLLLHKARAVNNIETMQRKAERSGVHLRPHFKTHQSAEVGEWFRQAGVSAITVSSVDMAHYFAEAGWQDITVAFPVNLRQLAELDSLASRVRLNLLVESSESAARLDQGLKHKVAVWLKIDAGYQRTGLPWQAQDRINQVARIIESSPRLAFKGLLTHAGHTYNSRSPEAVTSIYQEVLVRLQTVQKGLGVQGIPATISIGDTPGCSLVDSFAGVDEIRPGNYVFYDMTQLQIGSCSETDIAVAVACPVVAKHASRGQLILYGGAVHLAKESIQLADGRTIFGGIAHLTDSGWSRLIDDCYLVSMSQEHGIVQATPELFEETEVGDLLLIIPIHSCLTVNLYSQYRLLDGQAVPIARML